MITIEKSGKIHIPQEDGFIGYAGDNLNKKIEFLLKERNNTEYFYRTYLKFDDGTVNFFILEKKIEGKNTVLSWNITEDQIYKSGIVYLQIKGFDSSGEIFHTEAVPLIVGRSIEFGNYFAEKSISEYLQHEKVLNQLYSDVVNAQKFLPYIGENGNWFVYDYERKKFVDSNVTAKGSADSFIIDTAITDKASDTHVPSSRAVYNLKNTYSPYVTKLLNINGDLITTISSHEITSETGFSSNTALVYLHISPNVNSVAANSFIGCTNLRTVVIYNSEDGITIEANAFPEKTKIIYMYTSLPKQNKEIIDNLRTQIGNLSYLSTGDKSSLVNSINELNNTKLSNSPGAVKEENIKDGAVTKEKIAKNAVTDIAIEFETIKTKHIANNAIATKLIQDGAVTEDKIAENAIKSTHIADGEIINTKIANGTITSSNLSEGAVTSTKLANGSVTTAKLTSGAVNGDKIADQTIKTQHINSSYLDDVPSNYSGPYADGNCLITSRGVYQVQEDLQSQIDALKTEKIPEALKDYYNKADSKLRYSSTNILAFDENDAVIKTFDGVTIGAGVFTNNTKIVKVFIPSSVTEIKLGAFTGCSNLKELVIDNVEGGVIIHENSSGVPGGSIPSATKIVYSDTFNIITMLCKSVEYLSKVVSNLSENAKAINNDEK